MKQIEYIGCFFDPQILLQLPVTERQGPLCRTITFPHITFTYAPKEVPFSLFGTKVTAKVVGYGCDGVNEALQVEFVDLPQALCGLASEIPVPHITLSVAKNGKPFDSRFLNYRPTEPFFLEGIFGGIDIDGKLYTEKQKQEA